MKKLISYIALTLVLVSLLSSCGIIRINRPGEETTSQKETTSAPKIEGTDPPIPESNTNPPTVIPDPEKWEIRKNEAGELLNGQIKLDYTGKSLYMIDGAGTFSDPLIENNVYSEAKYERIKMLEEMYGYKITVSKGDASLMYDEFKSAYNSGNTYCDLISVPLCESAKYISAGLLLNLRSLPFFEASGKYSIPSFDTSRAASDDVYLSLGYATLAPSDLMCMYFNRSIMKDLEIDIYKEVLDEEFTIDRYYEIMTQKDLSSCQTSDFDATLTAIELSPLKFFDSGYKTILTFTPSRFVNAAESVADIQRKLTVNDTPIDEGDTAVGKFEDGDCTFLIGSLDEMQNLYDKKQLFGILPLPMINKNEGYKTPVSSDTAAIGITVNTAKSEMCSVTLSAMNAASYKWLLDSAGLLYSTYYIQDLKAPEAIKLILENPVLDFSASARGITPLYSETLIGGIKEKLLIPETDLTEYYTKAKLDALKKALSKYYS